MSHERVRDLYKAVGKSKPYHLGPGPGGGEFTTAALDGTSNGLPRGAGRPDGGTNLKPPSAASARGTQVAADDGVKDDAGNSLLNTWGRPDTLDEHVEDHASDFGIDPNAPNAAKQYIEQANQFLQNSRNEGIQMKVEPEGYTRVYDAENNIFGTYNPDGTTRSFYKPPGGQSYFDAQPGKLYIGGKEVISSPSVSQTSAGGGGPAAADELFDRPTDHTGRRRPIE